MGSEGPVAVEKYAKVMYDAEEVSHLPALLAGHLLVSHVTSIWTTVTLPGGALLWSVS